MFGSIDLPWLRVQWRAHWIPLVSTGVLYASFLGISSTNVLPLRLLKVISPTDIISHHLTSLLDSDHPRRAPAPNMAFLGSWFLYTHPPIRAAFRHLGMARNQMKSGNMDEMDGFGLKPMQNLIELRNTSEIVGQYLTVS